MYARVLFLLDEMDKYLLVPFVMRKKKLGGLGCQSIPVTRRPQIEWSRGLFSVVQEWARAVNYSL